MKPSTGNRYKNRILASLSKAEINRIGRHLLPVTLKHGEILLSGKSQYAYFLEAGVASVVVTVKSGSTVEVGVVGRDGVVGLPVLLGTGSAPGRTFIQIEGSGFRIKAQRLKEEFERPTELRRQLQKYVQAFLIQASQSAVCNRLHSIGQRLPRWLLTCRDRLDSDQVRITHEFLGDMLGAPRSTVTLAAGILHKAGLIESSRGCVTIKNRAKLEKAACECYRIVRNEFQRLQLL